MSVLGLPWSSAGKESAYNAGDWFNSWVGKIHWRRDKLSTPIFLGFLGGSAGKESACNTEYLGLIPRLGKSPGEGNWLITLVFWPRKFQGLYSPWGCKESDIS